MMKKLYFGLIALAALSFASCQKEQNVNLPEKNMVTVTLVADKAGDETKAAAVEEDSKVSYVWTDADKSNLKLYQVTTGADNKEVLTEVEPTIEVSSDNKILTITATVEENTTLRAVVAGEMTGGDTPKPKIKVNQSPATNNFDPNTDVLVADDVTVSEVNNVALTFRRQAVVNKMTLKNMVEGEKVKQVTISSESDLTGYYDYEKAKMLGQNKEIVMKYDDVAVGSTKEFPVYFVAMPNTGLTLTVIVKTDQYTYTKTFGNNSINFNLGGFTKFGVNLSGCGEEVVDVDYSGEWVIAGTHDGHELAATGFVSGNFYPATEVSIDAEGEIVTVFTESVDPFKMIITRITEGENTGLYTIMDANGKYLSAQTLDKNYMIGSDEPGTYSYWSIELRQDGTYDIQAANLGDSARKAMRLNYNNGADPRLTCYATSNSTQARPVLYPFANVEVGTPPTPTYDFESVAKLNEIVTSTSSTYNGYLTDAVVSFVPANNVAIIKDATGSVMYYKSNHGLKQGQTYTGTLTVTAIKYNDLYSEITAINGASFSGAQTAVAPASVSLADLINNYDSYQNAYVSVAGLTVTNINGKDIVVTDGTNEYVVYYNPGSPSCLVGDVITAIGTVTKYKTTEEIKVWAADGLEVTASTPKSVTFTQPTQEGCSIAVSVDGSVITSGTTVAAGSTVTLTATAGDKYSFRSWSVTGADLADASAATTTFTMGATEVVISASFVSNKILTIDFENDTETYTDWTFTNMISKQTGSIEAHGGTYYGTTGGNASASVTTKNKIQAPGTLTVYLSKQTKNTTSSTWHIQVSNDATTWTDVKTQSATSMSKGDWVEVSHDLSSYSNVYIRIYYAGSTAVRNIDDLSLSYN